MQLDVPQHPPLEIVKQGSLWVVEEFRQGARNGETFATHDTQISAVRFAKSKMESDTYPCVVRWSSPQSVGDIYWNPLFECLTVRYDELLNSWTVVPKQGTCAMTVCDSRTDACERAKRLQKLYDFKYLHVFDRQDEQYEERAHRFLRYDITRSGVRFDPDVVASIPDPPETDDDAKVEPATEADEDDESEMSFVGPATPSQLGASIPDVTQVEFVDTDGAVHRYATPWEGGTRAEIITVSSKYATDDGVPEAFADRFSRWRDIDGTAHVASITEFGTTPTRWVAYRVGEQTLADVGTELPVRTRLTILRHVVDAIGTFDDGSVPVSGVYPANIHLLEHDGSWRATVANWGIEWAVREVVGLGHSGPFLAPEQLDGRLAATTVVYQLGAVAHWLLCEELPADGGFVRTGTIPTPVGGVDPAVKSVLGRALSADPSDRYSSVSAFYRALSGSN